MDTIRFDVGVAQGAYPVHIGYGLITRFKSLVNQAVPGGRRFIVSSPGVWKLHGRTLAAALPDADTILISDGERSKHLQNVGRVYDGLIRAGADRQSTLLAVGGGVIGDVAGFAAATFLRGVRLVQVPTTLLAQVDSCIGGKVGVNHSLGKNLIGAFHPPASVLVDPRFLDTLPRREFRAGLYEVIKYGVIASRDLFELLGRELAAVFGREPDVLLPIIEDCCRIKSSIVEADERERGPRRVLNFGHTAGHAIEAVTTYRRFRHGEAIAYGMLVAADIATSRGLFDAADRRALQSIITHMGPLPSIGDLSAKHTVEAIARDKKTVGGKLHFVLPTAIGTTTIVDTVQVRQIERSLRQLGMRR